MHAIYVCSADNSYSTCEVLPRSGSRYADVIWTFSSHPSSVNLFRLALSGTQPCGSGNSEWFVRGYNNTGTPSECSVREVAPGDIRLCGLTCRCVDAGNCGYLHYRVQFPMWETDTLQLCHFELMTFNSGFVDPALVVYWVLHICAMKITDVHGWMLKWLETTISPRSPWSVIFGQIQDGRYPNNKIIMSLVQVLEFDFCLFVSFLNSEVSIRYSISIITGHGTHFEVICDASLYRKYLPFSPEWPSLSMFYGNEFISNLCTYHTLSYCLVLMVLSPVQHFNRQSLIMIL